MGFGAIPGVPYFCCNFAKAKGKSFRLRFPLSVRGVVEVVVEVDWKDVVEGLISLLDISFFGGK